MSVSDIFAALGGNAAVARAIGVRPSTTSEMKRRGRIPAEYWRDLVHAARAAGRADINADLLTEVHATRPRAEDMRGMAEEDAAPYVNTAGKSTEADVAAPQGQFTRWKHLRRSHFASGEEITEHIRALREEWDRR